MGRERLPARVEPTSEQTSERMSEQTSEGASERANERINEQMNERTNERMKIESLALDKGEGKAEAGGHQGLDYDTVQCRRHGLCRVGDLPAKPQLCSASGKRLTMVTVCF